jgi:hypothetical protein
VQDKIFISYRRADSGLMCDRIYATLKETFGTARVFRDIEAIGGGVDYRYPIEQALHTACVIVVLIGPDWLTAASPSGQRRLDDPQDPVRLEIELALRLGLVLMPLLVQQATIPKERDLPASLAPLAFRNARPVRRDPDYVRDMHVVIQDLRDFLPLPPRARPVRAAVGAGRRFVGLAVSAITVVLTVLSLATWIQVPILSDFVRHLLSHYLSGH